MPFIKSAAPVELAVTGARNGHGANGVAHPGFTAQDLQDMVRNHKEMGQPVLPIEEGRHTLDPNNPPQRAGRILQIETKRRADGETILQAMVDWTEAAIQAIVEGRLPNMSVEAPKNYTDPRTGKKLTGYVLRAAALVPRGFYDENDINPVRFESVEDELYQAGGTPPLTSSVTMETALSGGYIAMLAAGMANNENVEDIEDMETIKKLLGLPADADEAQVLAAIKELIDAKEGVEEMQAQVTAAEEATGVQLSAIPTAWASANSNDQVALLTERVNVLNKDLTQAIEDGQKAKETLQAIQLSAFIEEGQAAGKIGTVEDADGKNADVEFWKNAYKLDSEQATAMLSQAPTRYAVNQLTGVDVADKEPNAKLSHGDRVATLAVQIQQEEGVDDIQVATARAESRIKKEKQEGK